jgi:hypothetical protein
MQKKVATVAYRPKRLLKTRSRICAVSVSGDCVHAGRAYFKDRARSFDAASVVCGPAASR